MVPPGRSPQPSCCSRENHSCHWVSPEMPSRTLLSVKGEQREASQVGDSDIKGHGQR